MAGQFSKEDIIFMREALSLAEKAQQFDEVPVGAIVVSEGRVIGRGFNQREMAQNALLHAEMIALDEACKNAGSWRLSDATIYVTLEPCPMCAGAMVLARVGRLVYAADDPRSGAAGSVMDICRHQKLNHRLDVISGLLADQSAVLLKNFFSNKRNKNNLLTNKKSGI